MRVGRDAAVQIPSLGAKRYKGRVEAVGFAPNATSRSHTVKVAVPNPAIELRAGTTDLPVRTKYRAEAPPQQIHVSAARKEQEWVISISDNGIGFDQKYAQIILDLFKRLEGRKYVTLND